MSENKQKRLGPFAGKRHTEETKKLISEKSKEFWKKSPVTPEHRVKMSRSQRHRRTPEEIRLEIYQMVCKDIYNFECSSCGALGILLMEEEKEHATGNIYISHFDGDMKNLCPSNLFPLCKDCVKKGESKYLKIN